jgi:hypothetical protein
MEMETHIAGIPLSKLVDEAAKPRASEIWNNLSFVNVNDDLDKKNGYSYLSWSPAWATLMEHYPTSNFYFENQRGENGEVNNEGLIRFPDGTAEVRCVLTVDGVTRTMWLPVMDHRNNAIKNPNARDINDAKMRCLVKAMSLFGLGLYIYAGEDLPDAAKAKLAPKTAAPTDTVETATLMSAINTASNLDELKAAFSKASKYARNRNDDALLKEVTEAKDKRKAALSGE